MAREQGEGMHPIGAVGPPSQRPAQESASTPAFGTSMSFEEALARAKAAHVIVKVCNQPGENYRTQYRCKCGEGGFAGLIFAENWDQHILDEADALRTEGGEG